MREKMKDKINSLQETIEHTRRRRIKTVVLVALAHFLVTVGTVSAQGSSSGGTICDVLSTGILDGLVTTAIGLLMAFSVFGGIAISAMNTMKSMKDSGGSYKTDAAKTGIAVPIMFYVGIGIAQALFDYDLACVVPGL